MSIFAGLTFSADGSGSQAARGRGGWRQRSRSGATAPEPKPPSKLALGHLLEWGDGMSSARQVGFHMANEVDDQGENCHPMVRKLASIHDRGARDTHSAGKLMDLLIDHGLTAPIVDMDDPASPATHMIPPSKLLDILHTRFSSRFETLLGIDEQKNLELWRRLRSSTDVFAKHAVLSRLTENELKRVVPLTCHEDAAPFTKSLSVNLISFGGFFSRSGERIGKWPIVSYIQGVINKAQEDALWAPIIADFEFLATTGIGGWRFALVFAKGDLEVRANHWHLHHWNNDEPCTECSCNKGMVPYTDLRPSALWRATTFPATTSGTDRVISRSTSASPHPLLASSFRWRFLMPLDLMHVADCNGIMNHIAGSVLRPLVTGDLAFRLGGGTQADRLRIINTNLSEFYDSRPGTAKLPGLRLANLVNSSGWACLSGQVVKAANTRGLAPWLVLICDKYYNDDSDEYSRLVCRLCRFMDRFYCMLYAAGTLLTSAEVTAISKLLLRLGATYMALRDIAMSRSWYCWNVVMKVHYFQHFADLVSAGLNPRWVQCYAEESAVGVVAKAWGRSAHGRYRRTAQKVVLTKRLMSLYIRLEQQ